MHDEQAQAAFVERKKANVAKSEELGRFPANLAHDGSDEVVGRFPQSKGQLADRKAQAKSSVNCYGDYGTDSEFKKRGDEGSAARFFYCAKASKKDRGEGNNHPTVKPQALMEWLVKMVTREDAVVLDPFAGSGTTGVACMVLGRGFIGVEQDEHYCEIANGRIAEAQMKLDILPN
jgi:site-specific DNA-methyltransferase (adenine-specific)